MGGSLEPVMERKNIMTKYYMIKNQKILDDVVTYRKNYNERNKFIIDFILIMVLTVTNIILAETDR